MIFNSINNKKNEPKKWNFEYLCSQLALLDLADDTTVTLHFYLFAWFISSFTFDDCERNLNFVAYFSMHNCFVIR